MIRLLMKLAMTVPAFISCLLYWFVGAMLWDERPFKWCTELLQVVWSTNEPIVPDEFKEE